MDKNFITRSREDFDAMAHTQDVSLPLWGPYSSNIAGIVHIADAARGAGFHLSVFPRYYQGKAHLPTEREESFHFPWLAMEDLSLYTYRFEMEWKDRLYCDISYIRLHDDAYVIEVEATNNTGVAQQLGLHYLASMQYPLTDGKYAAWVKPVCDGKYTSVDGVEYDRLILADPAAKKDLPAQGMRVGEIVGHEMVGGHALGGRFGQTAGDRAEYSVPRPDTGDLILTIRAKGHATFTLSGVAEGEFTVDSDSFLAYTFPVSPSDEEVSSLFITCTGGSGAVMDIITLSDAPVSFVREEPAFVPQLCREDKTLTFSYESGHKYGIVWSGSDATLRELLGSDWASKTGTPKNIPHEIVEGDHNAHYTDLYVRPLFLAPYETKRVYSLVCHSTAAEDKLPEYFARWAEMDPEAFADQAFDKTRSGLLPPDAYSLSQQLLRAATLTNILYPFRGRNGYTRRFTGAKRDMVPSTHSLGLIALGLVPTSPRLAIEVLNSCLTADGEENVPFVHVGDPTPTVAYAYKALWDTTHNRAFLASFYPRLRQYYRFLMGRHPASSMRQMKSGILNPNAYMPPDETNDIPVCEAIREKGLSERCCPNHISTHTIVFARILRHASAILGCGDEGEYDADIASLGSALQAYAYDRRSGYFGCITHDEAGNPENFLRTDRFLNYNMGYDGAEILLSGICNPRQESVLSGFMMDPSRMWTDWGISNVDRSASYYRRDGFRNGTAGMTQQWFAFLGMLGCAHVADAFKIATTALDTWKVEAEASYNCYEHFVLETGRGGGWHCSSDAGAPLSLWYHTIYVPGNVIAPPDVFVLTSSFGEGYGCVDLSVQAGHSKRPETALVISLASDDYRVMVNGELVETKHCECAIGVRIPTGRVSHISIYPR